MSNVTLLDNPVLKYRPNSSVPVNIGAVAKRIAAHLGGKVLEVGNTSGEVYYVPFAAVHAGLAASKGITGRGNLYGGIVREHQHADKAMLHILPKANAGHPHWYSRSFAEAVRDVVLPGYTAFTQEDLARSLNLMRADGLSVRLKDPANTGGLGQYVVNSRDDLTRVMSAYTGKISTTGMVLEADLHGPVTITIGYVNIKGKTYTWHGRPYDVEYDGMTRFGGNKLLVVRGGLDVLRTHSVDPHDRLAIDQAERAFDAYSLLGATISRATLDVVQGTSCDGTFLSGVTDPSLRPSASSAAEIRAIEALAANPNATAATTGLAYDYKKNVVRSPRHEIFVDHSRMDILVELISVH